MRVEEFENEKSPWSVINGHGDFCKFMNCDTLTLAQNQGAPVCSLQLAAGSHPFHKLSNSGTQFDFTMILQSNKQSRSSFQGAVKEEAVDMEEMLNEIFAERKDRSPDIKADATESKAAVSETKAAFNTIFERVEIKYLVPKERYEAFMAAMEPYMQLDEYGLSAICNIYYDTDDNLLVSRSLGKPKYKEKLRLRSYGVPGNESIAFAEIKKKFDGVVYKRRAALPYLEAEAFLNYGIRPKEDSQIVREIAYFRDFYKPVPKLFLGYDREAYFGKKDPALRITIDRNIRYREKDLFLSKGDYGDLLDPDGSYLLEIKAGDAMPLYLTRILSELQLYPASFSKYGKIYTVTNAQTAVFENAGSGAQAENAGYTDRAAQAGNAGFADTLIQAEGTEDAGSRTEENSKRGYALCSQA